MCKNATDVLKELSLYFTSGNEVAVEKATIRSEIFWELVKNVIPDEYNNRVKNHES